MIRTARITSLKTRIESLRLRLEALDQRIEIAREQPIPQADETLLISTDERDRSRLREKLRHCEEALAALQSRAA